MLDNVFYLILKSIIRDKNRMQYYGYDGLKKCIAYFTKTSFAF